MSDQIPIWVEDEDRHIASIEAVDVILGIHGNTGSFMNEYTMGHFEMKWTWRVCRNTRHCIVFVLVTKETRSSIFNGSLTKTIKAKF